MPIPYFAKFPATLYDMLGDKNEIVVTNIMHRARIRDVVRNNTYVYYTYDVKDGETPETIAYKIYGSTQYHWVVLYANDILNPYYDWPLSYDDFQAVMIDLYGDLRTAQLTIHHYEDAIGNVIDFTTYDNLPSDERNAVSAYDYYYNLNESKRRIKLLDPVFLSKIDQELTDLLANVPD
jgi:Base plate wedge protein 53